MISLVFMFAVVICLLARGSYLYSKPQRITELKYVDRLIYDFFKAIPNVKKQRINAAHLKQIKTWVKEHPEIKVPNGYLTYEDYHWIEEEVESIKQETLKAELKKTN